MPVAKFWGVWDGWRPLYTLRRKVVVDGPWIRASFSASYLQCGQVSMSESASGNGAVEPDTSTGTGHKNRRRRTAQTCDTIYVAFGVVIGFILLAKITFMYNHSATIAEVSQEGSRGSGESFKNKQITDSVVPASPSVAQKAKEVTDGIHRNERHHQSELQRMNSVIRSHAQFEANKHRLKQAPGRLKRTRKEPSKIAHYIKGDSEVREMMDGVKLKAIKPELLTKITMDTSLAFARIKCDPFKEQLQVPPPVSAASSMTLTELFNQLASLEEKILNQLTQDKAKDKLKRISAILEALHRIILEAPPYPMNSFQGRGIVTCGGGAKYIIPLYALVKSLRHHGCTLPIDVWGFAGEQPTEKLSLEFQSLDVTFHVIDEVISGASAFVDHFALKIFALTFSRFQEVMFLDSDIVPLADPSYLFESVDYQEKRALFWSDYWKESIHPDLLKMACIEKTEWFGSFDSGVSIIDKKAGWRPLISSTLLSLHASDIYPLFTMNGIGIGDKEVLPFLYYASRTPFYRIQYPILPIGRVKEEPFETALPGTMRKFYGHTMGQHSPTGELLFLHKNCMKWTVQETREKDYFEKRHWTHIRNFDKPKHEEQAKKRKASISFEQILKTFNSEVESVAAKHAAMHCAIDMPNYQIETLNNTEVENVEMFCKKTIKAFVGTEEFFQYAKWRQRFDEFVL